VPLLAALTHKRFDEVVSFQEQIALAIDHHSLPTRNLPFSPRVGPRVSRNIGSANFQINQLKLPIRQNGRIGLIVSGSHTAIIKLVRESFEKKHRIAIEETMDQVGSFFETPMSPRRMALGGLLPAIVSACRATGLIPYLGQDDGCYLTIERSAPCMEDGMGPAGKKHEKL
jgi:hypothetical protein